MVSKSKALRQLRRTLAQLRDVRGMGTELITVYIPPKYAIAEVSNKLKAEYGQASNIKSKATRDNVQAALSKIVNYLKMFREAPDTGIAIFCGNISKQEGKPDVQLFSLSPHEAISQQFYRCDSTFVLEPLEDMIAAKDSYGLVVMDGRDATIAILKGKNTKIVRHLHSMAHAKIHKGGQSARRFQRLIEEAIEGYYKRIGEAMNEAFLTVPDFRGFIIGGPGPAKDGLVKMAPWNYQLKQLGVLDTGYVDEFGIKELQGKAGDIIAEQEAIKEKKLVDTFLRDIAKGGPAVYGEEAVRKSLDEGKVDTLLLAEGVELKRMKFVCSNGHETRLTGPTELKDIKCPSCDQKASLVQSLDLEEELIEAAEDRGAKTEIISSDTSEGRQFLEGFHGIGALLRYISRQS